MDDSSASWRNTTHDWARSVDPEHLALIRRDPAGLAPGGVRHLVLEVLAYAADEAQHGGAGRCTVTLHPDGSVSVADDGRGTDTRFDEHGRAVRKPVMATKDLRFFDHPDAESLPDGHPRRGMSVVAALSEWLVHTNRRAGGAWSQRYEYGVPATALTPVTDDGTTGTAVRFRPTGPAATTDSAALTDAACDLVVEQLAGFASAWPFLSVHFDDRRAD